MTDAPEAQGRAAPDARATRKPPRDPAAASGEAFQETARLAKLHLAAGEDAAVVGDPARQAVSALKGFAYQIYATALAWTDLPRDAELHVEVAEDFATAVKGALHAVQVKDAAGSVTLASQAAMRAVDSFVRLVSDNPGRQVRLTFLTTSPVGRERRSKGRPDGRPGLHLWAEAARGGDPGGLRDILLELELAETTKAFIRDRDDERLRRDLFERIDWRCGEAPLDDLAARLDRRVAEWCADELDVPPSEGVRVAARLVSHVLNVGSAPGARVLRHADLLALADEATRVSLPRADFDALFRATAVAFQDTCEQALVIGSAGDELESDIPLPPLLAARSQVVGAIAGVLRKRSVVVVHGGTGMGKTTLARLAARQLGGVWRMLDLRDLSARQIGPRLSAFSRAASAGGDGVIVDDVADLPDSVSNAATRALRRLASNRPLILTVPRPPSRAAQQALGISSEQVVEAPRLTEDETIKLALAAGADDGWGRWLHVASRGGHPQLANALATGLRSRGWPEGERLHLGLSGPGAADIDEERLATRRRVIEAVQDPDARTFLHRLSVVADRFPRSVALALGEVAPRVASPGEHLDRLLGPWIDQVADDRFRTSPLLAGAGALILSPSQLLDVHRAVAEATVSSRSLHPDQMMNTFVHGIAGKATRVLVGLAYAVVRATRQEKRDLRIYLLPLLLSPSDRPIYPEDLHVSFMLRMAQFELLLSDEPRESAVDCARALLREAAEHDASDRVFEFGALTRVLSAEGMSDLMPEWPALLACIAAMKLPDELALDLSLSAAARHPIPNLFVLNVVGLKGVSSLLSAFEALDALDAAARDLMLTRREDVPSPVTVLRAMWFRGLEAPGRNAAADAAMCSRMAGMAVAWGHPGWAAALFVAAATAQLEAPDGAEAALETLAEAPAEISDDAWIRRMRSRALHRGGRHPEVVEVLRSLAEVALEDDAMEATWMWREGALSASRLELHAQAADWFERAASAARQVELPRFEAMSVGLAADAAVARWRGGDRLAAMRGYVRVLDDLAGLDPDSSLQAGHTHRVVRHALLWFSQQAAMEASTDGQPPAELPAGCCSLPDPSPGVLDHPLVARDLVWYWFTEIASAAGFVDEVPDLGSRLKGDPVPMLEIMLRRRRVEGAILSVDPNRLDENLLPWLEAGVALPAMSAQLANTPMSEWARGHLPKLSPDDDGAASALARDVLLSFAILAISRSRHDAVQEMAATAGRSVGRLPGVAALLADLTAKPGGDAASRGVARSVAALLHGEPDPKDLLVAGIRMTLSLRRSDYRALVTPSFVPWLKTAWGRVASRQRFALHAPSVTAPAIAEAVAASGDTLREAAALLLAAADAVAVGISSEVRADLRRLARGEATAT